MKTTHITLILAPVLTLLILVAGTVGFYYKQTAPSPQTIQLERTLQSLKGLPPQELKSKYIDIMAQFLIDNPTTPPSKKVELISIELLTTLPKEDPVRRLIESKIK
jgi:hypothetical protein